MKLILIVLAMVLASPALADVDDLIRIVAVDAPVVPPIRKKVVTPPVLIGEDLSMPVARRKYNLQRNIEKHLGKCVRRCL